MKVFSKAPAAALISFSTIASACAAAERVLDERLHHLRSADQREWTVFPEDSEGKAYKATFAADPARAPYTLRLRQHDVKQQWRLRLNDHTLGSLPTDENDMTTFWEIPAAALVAGENQFAIEGAGRPSDDIEVGDLRLIDQSRERALRATSLSVAVVDAESRQPIPARITVVDDHGSLMTVGAESSKRLAVRPGVIYTIDGNAEFGLPAGKYTLYGGRGFEYSVDSKDVELAAGQRKTVRLAIRREVPMCGYVSCDTHVHTLTYSGHGDASLDERLVTLACEGLELPIATDHNIQIDYRPTMEKNGLVGHFAPVVGNEVTTKVGHFNVFPLDPAGPIIDFRGATWPSVFEAIGLDHGRVIVLNHPRDLHGGFRPFDAARHLSAAGEELDGWKLHANAMELVNSGALRSDPWQLVYDWLGLLNAGHRISPVGSSDSHDVARSIVGQARTYIRCRDDQPGKIDVAQAIKAILAGQVLVSFGLAADVEANGNFSSGDIVPAMDARELEIHIRVFGPSWSKAREVMLFVNGREARRQAISDEAGGKTGVQYESTWTIPTPPHDAHLVVVAIGPGISKPYWPTAKPYQPDSPDWTPYTLAATGALYVDSDGSPGYTSPREYAIEILGQAGGNIDRLIGLLDHYDEATAIQAAAVMHERGELADGVMKKLQIAPKTAIRAAMARYFKALRESLDH